MRRLNKTVFYFKDKAEPSAPVRLWHECSAYKGGRHGVIRAELNKLSETDETADYKCPHCDFTYSLNKFFELVEE